MPDVVQHDGEGRSATMIRKIAETTAEVVDCPHPLGATAHLESPLAADPGDQRGEDPRLDQARGEVEDPDAVLRLLDVGRRR